LLPTGLSVVSGKKKKPFRHKWILYWMGRQVSAGLLAKQY